MDTLTTDKPKVVIVFEDGITSAAYVSDPEVQIEIVELDRNYLSSEQREQVYTALFPRCYFAHF